MARRVLPFSGDALDVEAVLRPGTAKALGRAVALFAEGGAAGIVSLRAWPLAAAIGR